MLIKSWWNRVLRLTNESQFGNLRTSYEQPKFLQLDHISAASKTQIKQTKNSMAAICIFIDTRPDSWQAENFLSNWGPLIIFSGTIEFKE